MARRFFTGYDGGVVQNTDCTNFRLGRFSRNECARAGSRRPAVMSTISAQAEVCSAAPKKRLSAAAAAPSAFDGVPQR